MISSETSPATCLTSEHPTQGQAARKIVEGGRYQGLTDQSPPVASDGHSQTMERDLTHDASFLQATEFPGFPRPNNTGPAESPSGKRPFPSELSEGSEERPAYRQRSHTDFSESSSHGRDPSHRNGTPTPERASESTQAAQITSAPRSENPAVAMDAPIEPAPSEPSGITQTQIDSAFDDGASASFSLTDTLNSSVSDYRWENGRRYHAYRDGAYWGPNDELHNDQQDIAHKAWTLSIGNRLFQAPLDGDKVHRALDVGTGTGLWAIEFAELFPDAQVTGTDLSPIQPDWVPPNCMFEVDDVTLDWTFRKNSFDFIHSREMFGSIADWDFFFAQCYAHCKPGGYVECLERGVKPLSDDGTVGPDHFYTLWGQTVLDMGRRWGKGFDAFEIIKEKMERAGFVDVVETKMKWPIGGWPKDRALRELGLWNAVRLDTGIEGYVMRLFTQAGGVSSGFPPPLFFLFFLFFLSSFHLFCKPLHQPLTQLTDTTVSHTVVLRRRTSLHEQIPRLHARPFPPRLPPRNLRLRPKATGLGCTERGRLGRRRRCGV